MLLELSTTDADEISQLLQEQGVQPLDIEPKGVVELQTVFVALGGGVGIAGIIKAVAAAVDAYFQGRAADEKARKIEVSFGEMKMMVTGKDSLEALEAWLKVVSKQRTRR